MCSIPKPFKSDSIYLNNEFILIEAIQNGNTKVAIKMIQKMTKLELDKNE